MKFLVLALFLFFNLKAFAQYDCRVLNPDTSGDEFNAYRIYNKTIEQCQSWFSEKATSFKCEGTCLWGYEDKSADYLEEAQKRQIDKDRVKGQAVLTHVVWLNDQRNATDGIKIQFLADPEVQQAKALLEVGRIDLARSVVNASTVDGEVKTQALKDAILEYIDNE